MEFNRPTPQELMHWKWQDFKPYYDDLLKTELSEKNISTWMAQWTQVSEASSELFERLYVATSVNTADEMAEENLKDYMENTYPQVSEMSQQLKEKLLKSGLVPEGFAIPMRNMRAEAALFRKENIALEVELNQLSIDLDKILGAQTVQWKGEEQTARQMEIVFRDKDRGERARGWELTRKRQLEDRQAIDENWKKKTQN